jgi:hypothetical protein
MEDDGGEGEETPGDAADQAPFPYDFGING